MESVLSVSSVFFVGFFFVLFFCYLSKNRNPESLCLGKVVFVKKLNVDLLPLNIVSISAKEIGHHSVIIHYY